MSYTVIGWTEYDNDLIETGENDDAAVEAILADIREYGYCFSGYAHQEFLCGAPVLSDHKKRLFTQRNFGALMAVAHGLTKEDYPLFAFEVPESKTVMPDLSRRVLVDVEDEELKEILAELCGDDDTNN